MLNHINRMRKDEDGQAMVVAAIGLLIMAIGVLATAQIGFAVFERQKLQTLADAQAYSLATMHARAYNFFAFTNRAMVVHYVTMMHMQGIISALTLMEVLTGRYADLYHEACAVGNCMYPPVGEEFCLAFDGLFYARVPYTTLINTLDPIVKQFTDLLFNTNKILFTAQTTFAVSVLLNNVLSPLFNQLLNKTDKDIDVGVSTAVSDVANTYVAASILDMDSMKLPNTVAVPGSAQGDDEVIVTEIANATRVPENILTKRSISSLISGFSLPVGDLQGGQSRMLELANKDNFKTKLPTGNVMTSKDSMKLISSLPNVGGSFDMEVTVRNDTTNGLHTRYWDYQNILSPGAPIAVCVSDRWAHSPTTNAMGDGNHGGWQGIGPFMTLKAGNMDAKHDFGQHGVVAWLNKKTEKLSRKGLEQKFTLHAPTYQKKLDTSIGRDSALTSQMFRGINSIATAQIYYHRPGNWREVPNLFNPFWKARLYPVAQWVDKWVASGVAGNTMPAELMALMQYVVIH